MASGSQAIVPALGRLWLHELTERCAKEGVPLPGGEALHQKLAQSDPPMGARGKLAQAIHNEWVKGHNEVPAWQLQALVEAIEAWWQLLPEGSTPLSAGLVPAWVRAQGALGRIEPLARAALQWQAALAEPEHEAVALALLRQLRKLKGEASLAPSFVLIDGLGRRWAPDAPWTNEIAGTLAMIARAAETIEPLQRVAAWLDRLAPHAGRPEAQAWRAPLTAAAVRCAALPALRTLAEAMLGEAEPDPGVGATLASAIEALAVLSPDGAARPLVERAAKAWPKQPTIQIEQARMARAAGATVHELAPALRALEASHPATPAAWQLLAEYAFQDGELALAQECYQRLAELGALDEQSQLRQAHLSLHGTGTGTGAPAPSPELPEAGPQRLDPEQLGPLAEPLAALDAVLALPPRHDSPVSVADMELRCARALAAFERALPALEGLTLAEASAAASHLWELANSGALDLANWEGVFPFEVGPAFGTLDGYRCRAQSQGVLKHLIALGRHMQRRDRPLRGAPGDASIALLLELMRQQLDAQLTLKQAREALADLDEAQQRLGPLGAGALPALRERALLGAGEINTLRAELAAVPGAQPQAPRSPEPWPMREWDDWLRAEGVAAHALVQDAACSGEFEVVDVNGRLRTEHHSAVATALSLARVTDLRVRNVHLLIGQKGGVLKPHPWHLQMGEFPYPHPNVLARGAHGTVLRRAGLWKRHDEPLAVLANMDAPFHRNYYHWMVLTLTRIQALLSRGILKTRKLLLPRELTGWMQGSLKDIGLDESRIRWYSAQDDLRLTDAVIASPTEFASGTLVAELRATLMRAAGLDPDAPPAGDRLIYLARRGETRRPMAEAEQVIAIAEELGFEIVAAETLSLLDQVRLFAGARGIAGPPGAAFTNLMWAPAGTRVLTIFKQDINGPTFFDLSFLRGQHHRWLQAKSVAGFDSVSVVTSPFSVDLKLARRELEWVRGA
ncbi:glycosyltransferase family 61 protein [Ideonella sp.]|uniref:glycosyltransferase family 61 protein n=1 Tax=Ideonella sp. TaxID=1929293 RepID=UPI002B47C646|nr:glycosyltransferase family 61 protein [Ideonella sp.]